MMHPALLWFFVIVLETIQGIEFKGPNDNHVSIIGMYGMMLHDKELHRMLNMHRSKSINLRCHVMCKVYLFFVIWTHIFTE
jgi:hypothetical protein